MWRVKKLADPDGVLSPGVVLNRDSGAHLRNLKTTPPIEESATTCVECGFCEPVCPSRNLTTTPRQRIVLRREMARQPTGSPVQKALLEEFEYEALDTCAADGSCQLACPVGIDTGAFVKEMRTARHTERAEKLALATAKRWGTVEGASRAGLRLGPLAHRTERGRALPPPAPRTLPPTIHTGAAAVYVPSCTNRIFGAATGGRWAESSQPLVANRPIGPGLWRRWWRFRRGRGCRFGFRRTWWGLAAGCLGARKGSARRIATRRTRWSSGSGSGVGRGRCRSSSTPPPAPRASPTPVAGVLTEENAECLGKLEILDSVAWAHDRLLPWLDVSEKVGSATVHPTCATRHLGLTHRLEALAGALADDVFVPPTATCCGFAGDRGISHPELTDVRHRGRGERGRRPPLRCPPRQQPHLRDRPRARHRRALRVGHPPARAPHPFGLRGRTLTPGGLGGACQPSQVSRDHDPTMLLLRERVHAARPHFHASYAESRASFDAVDLTRLAGKLPLRIERVVRNWAANASSRVVGELGARPSRATRLRTIDATEMSCLL